MPEISTLFFIYGIEDFQTEEIRRLETEFSKELQWLDRFMEDPSNEVIKKLLQKVKES